MGCDTTITSSMSYTLLLSTEILSALPVAAANIMATPIMILCDMYLYFFSCIIFFVVFCFRVQRYEVFLHCAIPIYMENEGLAGSEVREVREFREIRVS